MSQSGTEEPLGSVELHQEANEREKKEKGKRRKGSKQHGKEGAEGW
jgi:hypothetical protein